MYVRFRAEKTAWCVCCELPPSRMQAFEIRLSQKIKGVTMFDKLRKPVIQESVIYINQNNRTSPANNFVKKIFYNLCNKDIFFLKIQTLGLRCGQVRFIVRNR